MEAVRPQVGYVVPYSRCGGSRLLRLSENGVVSVRRVRSDVPRRQSSGVAVVAAGPGPGPGPGGSELKKVSRRRARGRVATVEAVDPDADPAVLMGASLYDRLEEAYRRPSFATLMSDFRAKLGERGDADLVSYFGLDSGDESQLASLGDDDDAPFVSNAGNVSRNAVLETTTTSSSSSAPKAVKKRGRRPNAEGNRILKITKNPVTRRPRKVAVKVSEVEEREVEQLEPASEVEVQPVEEAVAVAERGGKRRLSLRSRIAMKQSKQSSSATVLHHPDTLSPEDQVLWSQEVEELITKYSTSLDLTAPLWDHLDRGLLTAAEENRLAVYMKPMKKLMKLEKLLVKQLDRELTDEEWASAAGVDSSILRRRLALGRAARTKLIQRNLRLVLSQAYKYHKESTSLSIPDLCQEGVVGLMQAVDKFDPSKGYRFSTYGIYWIRNSILRAQTKSGHMLRSPHNISTQRVNIKRARVELEEELGRPATNEEIQQHLGIAADRFRDILRTNMKPSSLHELDRVTGREKVESLVSNEDALSGYASSTSMVQYGLDDVLDSLRPKENLVLRQRFGLDGKGQRSLSEVGLILNLSREMVRRHELRGILKLQHPTRVEYLRNYLT